jgi:hypothetical protein
VNIAFLATAIIANLLRCFVRVRMVKAFGVDDWLMVGATVSDTEYLALLHTLNTHSSFSLDMVFHRT